MGNGFKIALTSASVPGKVRLTIGEVGRDLECVVFDAEVAPARVGEFVRYYTAPVPSHAPSGSLAA
jgi:hypothetical protein